MRTATANSGHFADLATTRGRVEFLESQLDRLKANNRELKTQVSVLEQKLANVSPAQQGREEN